MERDNGTQGADIQSKVEELEELNQALRNRDKMKDDAIAQLSDQPPIVGGYVIWTSLSSFKN